MLTYNPDDEYWNAVCMLLPKGNATLVDLEIFERYGHLPWQAMGATVYYSERYTVVVNPTARTQNRKHRVRYRIRSLHRLVMSVPYDRMVDHMNRDRSDNRRRNLRVATGSQNAMNTTPMRNKSSRYKGVHQLRGQTKWVAKVMFEGNRYHLGTFESEIEAAMAYNAFVKAYCPDFGYLNPIHGATADEAPTVSKPPPEKRRSRLKKPTPSEMRLKRIHASSKRQTAAMQKAQAVRREQLANRTPEETDAIIQEALEACARARPDLYPEIPKLGL